MASLNNVVYLSDAQYATLINNGSITVGDKTVTYNANDLYVTPTPHSGLYLHHVILYTTFDSYNPAAAVFDVVCNVSTAITSLNQIINHCVTFGNLGLNSENTGGYYRGFNPDGDERSWGFCIFGKLTDTVSQVDMYAYNEGGGNFYGRDSYTLGPAGSGQTNTYTITDTVAAL